MQINFAGDLGKRMPEKPYTEHIPNLTAGRWNIHCALESQAHLTVSSKRMNCPPRLSPLRGSCDRRKEDW